MRKIFGSNRRVSSPPITPEAAGTERPVSAHATPPDGPQLPNATAPAKKLPVSNQSNEQQAGEPFRSRGDELAQKNDYNGAVVMYNAAIDSAPNDLTLLLSRATAHSMSQPPRLDLALADAEAAIKVDRKSWQAWLQKGEILSQQNDLANAAQALAMSVSFAQGTDKIVAQRALGNVRARREQQPQQQQENEDLPPPAYEVITQPQPAPARQSQTGSGFSAQLAQRETRSLRFTSSILTDGTTSTASSPAPLLSRETTPVAQNPRPAANQGRIHIPSGQVVMNPDVPGVPPGASEAAIDSVIRADDYEAMMINLLPADPDLRTVEQMYFTWTIEDWKSLQQKEFGPVFKCGGLPWQILLYPQGNGITDHVSMYFKSTRENSQGPEDWHACVQFALVMWSPSHQSNYASQASKHRFNAEDPDWGFTKFVERRKIPWLPDSGHGLTDSASGQVNITAYVRLVEDPTGVLWHNFFNYDSKKATGMVGLLNQGATGYLNTLLQTLYCIPAFRKAVYQIPTKAEARQDVAWALQHLFYQLQTSNTPVSTRELTGSFGWGPRELFVPQDIQEMWRILTEKLEQRAKGTAVHSALRDLFIGKTKTYISNAGSLTEDFWDLQLNVRGHSSLDEGFKDYIRPMNLGADEQDAEQGVIFESFPPVLNIYLKRYTYDPSSLAMVKVNDYFSFPEEFDAAPYLSDKIGKSESWVYALKGVIVHDGDINQGSYYAYLRPQQVGPFYKFSDDKVIQATKKEAVDGNFGEPINGNGRSAIKKAANAYALVYVRKSRLYEIISDVKVADIPKHIIDFTEEQRSRKQRTPQVTEFVVHLITNESFQKHSGFDLSNPNLDPSNGAAFKQYNLPLRTKVGEFTLQIAREKRLRSNQLRLWTFIRRQNRTMRPFKPLLNPNESLREACDQYLWVEVGETAQSGSVHWPMRDGLRGTSLIFLKHFEVWTQTLLGVGHVHLPKDSKIGDLASYIINLMGWPDNTNISLFEEIKPSMVEPLKSDQTLVEAELGDGDIIIFQKTLGASAANYVKYTDAQEYCKYLCTTTKKPLV